MNNFKISRNGFQRDTVLPLYPCAINYLIKNFDKECLNNLHSKSIQLFLPLLARDEKPDLQT
uniref:Uncharacterized protein n=1 Tax=Yersinia enterocolitica TaxID=630 RepID=B0RKY9_YEREN|nr:hypothetical protein [Yersinia enterocolitica]